MAFEPYLMNRRQGCFRAPLPEGNYDEPNKLPRHDPDCTPDKYTDYFRGRWNILRQDVCNPCPPKPLCPIKPECEGKELYGPVYKPSNDGVSTCTGICIPYNAYQTGVTHTGKIHAYPRSHNNVDDCCKAKCPCEDKPPEAPKPKKDCTRPRPYPPLDSCTTYKHFFTEKPTPCPSRRHMPDPYDPCENPLESATSYRLEYEPKSADPQGEAFARMIRRGLWSMEQFDKNFTDDTVTKFDYDRKCGRRPAPFLPRGNLKSGQGCLDYTSETCAEFGRKCPEDRPPYPGWIHNDTWHPPATAQEKCTTYKHFYKPHPIRPWPGYEKNIRTPDAIPFSSMNNMWYTCCDPVVDQTGPVELKDNDPWPRVLTCPIRYQNNLQTDPCAPLRDETTYKADYWAKKRCAPNKSYGPVTGYTPPILPFTDNTTNRVSYVAYPPDMIRDAKQNAGNPRGIKWGSYRCPPEEDKCRPRFPPPYGDPIKAYTYNCPCGQFDDRSMYHQDFKFWTPEMVDQINEENCKTICVPRGLSLYRRDYADGAGKRAALMPPPRSKGERCMRPCPYHQLDTLYRLNYRNFWKDLPYERVNKYRGKPFTSTRRARIEENLKEPESITMFQMPPGTTIEETLQFLQKEQQQRK